MTEHDVRVMNLRRDGECACGTEVPRGSRAGWHRTQRIVVCLSCLEGEELPPPVEVGAPGASLQRTYERRIAAREQATMERHPRIGRLLLRLQAPPPTTTAFAKGAVGERQVAEHLGERLGDSVLFLWNRRLGASSRSGDIDILAVAASGVHVIDPKHYPGRTVRATRRRDALVVDGRRRPNLSASMRRQVDAVAAAVAEGSVPTAPVHGTYCFLKADLPWRSLVVDGAHVLGLRGTLKLLERPGPLDAEERERLHRDLALRFPPA